MDNPGNISGTTGRLSTRNGGGPKLLSARPEVQDPRPTVFAATQVRASIGQTGLVHRNGPTLLLLLFIYRATNE